MMSECYDSFIRTLYTEDVAVVSGWSIDVFQHENHVTGRCHNGLLAFMVSTSLTFSTINMSLHELKGNTRH